MQGCTFTKTNSRSVEQKMYWNNCGFVTTLSCNTAVQIVDKWYVTYVHIVRTVRIFFVLCWFLFAVSSSHYCTLTTHTLYCMHCTHTLYCMYALYTHTVHYALYTHTDTSIQLLHSNYCITLKYCWIDILVSLITLRFLSFPLLSPK